MTDTNDVNRREFLKGVSTPVVLSSTWFGDEDDESWWESWFGDDEDDDDAITVYGGESAEKEDINPDGKSVFFAYDEDAWYKRGSDDLDWKLSATGGSGESLWYSDTDGTLKPKNGEPISVERASVNGPLDADKVNNSAVVGSGFSQSLTGEGFNDGSRLEGWYENVDSGLSLTVANGNEITGRYALDVTHSGSGTNEYFDTRPLIPPTEDISNSWVAQECAVDVGFRPLNSVSEIRFYLRSPGNTLVVRWSSGNLEFFDGSVWVTGTAVSAGSAITLQITPDYSNDQYSVEWAAGGSSGTETGLGFANSADYINRHRWEITSSTNEKSLAIDHYQYSLPVFLCLGDSITNGSTVSTLSGDGTDSYAYQLNQKVGNWIFTHNTSGASYGETQWATEVFKGDIQYYRPSRVLLAFGARDVHNNRIGKDAWLNNYLSLVTTARQNGVEPVGWLMTPRNDTSKSKQLDWKNSLQAELDKYGIPYVNAWDELTDENDDQLSSYFEDSVHPNPSGHDRLTDRVISDLNL